MKSAIVLCSGGLDSVTTAYYVKNKLNYNKIMILFFDYGQKSLNQERRFSKECAKSIKAEFIEIKLKQLENISGSLINRPGKMGKIDNLNNTKKESDKFYVPCRNTLFLVNALAFAEARYVNNKEINEIFVGFKCEGKESYPDTTIKFVKEMNNLTKISCNYPFKIIAPLIEKDKEDIILLGEKIGVNFEKTFSCYVSKNKHCGVCLSCKLRKAGFYWAGVKDPTRYQL